MGEYAKYGRHEIKIGTCENMYYLRADQRHLVTAVPNSVDPVKDAELIRFRFPFPDEDQIAPGAFKDDGRSVAVNAPIPDDVDHGLVQFRAQPGYLVSLPCPESKAVQGIANLTIAKNGFSGNCHIVQQRLLEGAWVLVLRCGGCGTRWRCPTLADAQPVIDALIREAESRESAWQSSRADGKFWRTVAERIIRGYKGEV